MPPNFLYKIPPIKLPTEIPRKIVIQNKSNNYLKIKIYVYILFLSYVNEYRASFNRIVLDECNQENPTETIVYALDKSLNSSCSTGWSHYLHVRYYCC